MSTALSIPQASLSTFIAFDDANEQVQAFRANTEGIGFSPQDMIVVKTPSAETQFFAISRAGVQNMVPKLSGLLVYQARQGTLWPTLGNDGEKQTPVLITRDMQTAILNPARVPTTTRGEDGKITDMGISVPAEMVHTLSKLERPDGTWDWTTLPYTQFGTGKEGRGKFAKEQYFLFILQPGDVVPIVFRTGASAIKPVQKFLRELQVVYWRTNVEITLAKTKSGGGKDYNELRIAAASVIPAEEGAVVKAKMTDVLAREWRSGSIDTDDDAE